MAKFAHDEVMPFRQSELDKKDQVAQMFNSIAFRYDFLNRFLSAGIDKGWRKKAINQLKDLNPKLILDVATGTGDVPLTIIKDPRIKKITGIDLSKGMVDIGIEKVKKKNKYRSIENYLSLLLCLLFCFA